MGTIMLDFSPTFLTARAGRATGTARAFLAAWASGSEDRLQAGTVVLHGEAEFPRDHGGAGPPVPDDRRPRRPEHPGLRCRDLDALPPRLQAQVRQQATGRARLRRDAPG